jgi:hypothetical protein
LEEQLPHPTTSRYNSVNNFLTTSFFVTADDEMIDSGTEKPGKKGRVFWSQVFWPQVRFPAVRSSKKPKKTPKNPSRWLAALFQNRDNFLPNCHNLDRIIAKRFFEICKL